MANSKASRKASPNNPGAKSRSSAGAKAIARRQVSYGKPARTAADVIAEARGRKSNLWFCIPAFIIPFVLTLISYILFDVYPFGERSVLTLDLNGQYIYYFEALRDSFWGDGSPFYSWSRNLSGGFMGIIGYYLASPFTLIVMLLPRKMIIESVMIMQMCKVGAAGAAFCVYAQRSKKLAPLQSVVFSTMYAMMSYVVIQLIDPMWIDGPIFLPLIILGLEYLVDDGRKINYIIPLAIMFVANFYIGFMVAIFVALYFGYYMFFGTDRKFKNTGEYVRTFGVMALSTLVVLMLSAFMILPVYNALALGKFDFSQPDYSFKTMFNPLELVPCLLPNQYYSVNVDEGTLYYGRPEIYCGVLTFVLMPFYFMNKKIKSNKKIGNSIFLVIMFMCMYIKPLNMMWHGGQDPNWLPYRYSFLVSFLLVAMAAEVFANLDGYNLSMSETGVTFGIITVLVLLFEAIRGGLKYATKYTGEIDPFTNKEILNEKYRGYDYVQELPGKYTMKHGSDEWDELFLGTIVFGLLLVAVYVLFVFGYSRLKNRKSKNILTLGVAAVVLFETGYNCYDSFRKIFLEVGNSDKSTYTEILEAPKVVEELEEYDGSFYRAEKTYDRMVNDNLAYGLKGISHSSSVMNTRAIKLLEAMGYVTQSFESKYEGNSTLADSLLGIKYVLDNPFESNEVNSEYIKRYTTTSVKNNDETYNIDVYENPYALSIGFMADDDILSLGHLGNDNTFNSLNNFLSALMGKTQFIQNPDKTITLIPEEYYELIDIENNFELALDPRESDDPYNTGVSNGQVRARIYNHIDSNGVSIPHYCFDAEAGAADPVVNIHFTAQNDGEVYMRLDSEIRRKCNLWISNSVDENGNFSNHKGYGQYFTDNTTPLVRIGPFKKGEKIEVRLRILEQEGMNSFTGQNEYVMFKMNGGFSLYTFNMDKFRNDIAVLQENPWVIDTDKSNDRYLEGKVTAKKGQILMTSIPYEPGWTVKIDGKKVDNLIYEQKNAEGVTELMNKDGAVGQVAVLESLIAIKLPEGEHTVSMKYTPPGFKLGVVTFILGIAALVMFYIYDRKNNRVMIAKRELKAKAKERKKLGLPAEEESAETPVKTEKKKVQIIKSKGAVDPELSESAKKKAEIAKAEEEKIRSKNQELLEKGRVYAENADQESAEEKDEPETKAESVKNSGNQNRTKPKSGNKSNSKKKK